MAISFFNITTIAMIIWAISLGILLVAAIIGLIGGLRRGAYHAGVKLGAHILSVALALLLTLLLRGVVVGAVSGVLVDKFPQLEEFADLIELVAHIPASFILLAVFWIIFVIVRALMTILQKKLCEKLPANYAEAMEDYQKRLQMKTLTPPAVLLSEEVSEPADLMAEPSAAEPYADDETETADSTLSADGMAVEAMTEFDPQANEEPVVQAPAMVETQQGIHPALGKLLWYGSAALCGILSSVMMLGVMIMPVSSTTVRLGTAMTQIVDALESEPALTQDIGVDFSTAGNFIQKTTLCPLFSVTDFIYGKTVYEPLTSFSTAYGKINLTKELNSGTEMVCELVPVMAQAVKEEALREKDAKVLADVTKLVTESDFFMAVGTFIAQQSAEDLEKNANDESQTPAKQELNEKLAEILSEMTPSLLAEDLETVADCLIAVADSSLLKVLTDDQTEPSIENFTDREMMQELFGILHDNEHTRHLFVPLVNVGAEAVFKEMKIDPIYSNANLDRVSRKEMIAEADRLCDAMAGIDEFTKSVDQGGNNAATYRMVEAGKALDCLRESILFGNRYEALVKALSAVGDDANNKLMNALSDAILKSDSAENLLNSAHSVLILSDQLDQKDSPKGRENEQMVSSLDTLLNRTQKADANILADLAGDAFDTGNGTTEQKEQMIKDCVGALSKVSEEGTDDIGVEADAVQAFYDITHTEAEDPFTEISEAEVVEALVNSKLAQKMLNTLNAEGRDYGVRAKLTSANQKNLHNALKQSEGDAAAKAAVATFFGIDW